MKPELFIGSSVEGLSIAEAIESKLHHLFNTTIWTDGVFNIGSTAVEDLLSKLETSDFGVFVFTADDLTIIRDTKYTTARDNVVYELGLYTGNLGRHNTFIIMPSKNESFHLPSDLTGITIGTFNSEKTDNPLSAVSPFCSQIKRQVFNAKKFVLNGNWKFTWTASNSKTYPNEISDDVEVFHYQDKIKFLHSIGDDEKYLIEASFKNTYLTGTWNDSKGVGYYGSFQMKLNGQGNTFIGVWIGWDSKGQINSGPVSLVKT